MNYLELLKGLDPTQILEFKNYLREDIVELISNRDDSFKIIKSSKVEQNCPKCNHKLWKNGHVKNKVQKYICLHCKETTTETKFKLHK